MRCELFRITEVRFTPSSAVDAERGLLGYVACTLNGGIGLDGLTLRRASDGRRYVAFPARRDRKGRDHPYVRPLDADARDAIEGAILDELWAQGALP